MGPPRPIGLIDLWKETKRELTMQTSIIIESNGSGKERLDKMLAEGYTVVSITANHGKSYNDFLIILEK